MADKIKGGLADKMSLEDIARKHSVFLGTIQKEFKMGVKVEMEHTNDEEKAKEIALDHLVELPDYYTRLEKMEKEGEKKLQEPKEVTDAGASGSYESPMSMPIMKRDIHNFKLKSQEVKEVTGSGVSAGAMYDAPIGTGKKDPLAIDNPPSKKSSTESASITAASTKDMIATKKGFPKFGGPDAKFVEIKDKCKKFPYCNQMSGYDNLILKEGPMKVAIETAAKKYGISERKVMEYILKEAKHK
jgi:hypothetical protein